MTGRRHRVRLREVISTYHRAAPTDGPQFAAAAGILAAILARHLRAHEIVPAITTAIAEATDPAVRDLLTHARDRVTGAPITAALAANNALNAQASATHSAAAHQKATA